MTGNRGAETENALLVCAGCGAVVVGESDEAVRGLAWLHMQDCQGVASWS
jgi:hypothetical protein